MEKEVKKQQETLNGYETKPIEAPEYLKVGEIKIVDGKIFIKSDYIDDGLAFGYIFKDKEAYEKDWDAICYVPEYAFDDAEVDDDGFAIVSGYTHNQLLDMCYGNREWCDYLFSMFMWAEPDTYMDEWEDEDIAYFYRFIKPNAKVWWNDPAGETSGEYTVFEVPFEFDEDGELIEPETFGSDAIIHIGDGFSEVEVSPFELTPIYQ